MMKNKKGEEMVEAAMVLPLVILVCLSLLLVMLHDWDVHYSQVKVHQDLMNDWNSTAATFDIEKKNIETSSKIRGAVEMWIREERTCRSYIFSPAVCIRLEEMLSFDDGE